MTHRPSCGLLTIFALLVSLRVQAAPATPPSQPNVTVQLGDVHLRDPVQMLTLGNVAVGSEATGELTIDVEPASQKLRVYCEGQYLFCRWAEQEQRTDHPSKGGKLLFRFAPASLEPQPHSMIITDDRGKPIALIVVDYQLLAKKSVELKLQTPGLASGFGKDWGPWYTVCSGPAPKGYTLSSEGFGVTGPDGRGCTAWVNCERHQRNDQNVCWVFQVQGREAQFPDGADIVKANATLTVTWDLVPLTPSLVAIPR